MGGNNNISNYFNNIVQYYKQGWGGGRVGGGWMKKNKNYYHSLFPNAPSWNKRGCRNTPGYFYFFGWRILMTTESLR